jgi:EAL domain-containing protein (putative c-di-GMP-specific phosphodiesterase class I)
LLVETTRAPACAATAAVLSVDRSSTTKIDSRLISDLSAAQRNDRTTLPIVADSLRAGMQIVFEGVRLDAMAEVCRLVGLSCATNL